MVEKEADEILYWCGLRMGELLDLTKEKFDFKTGSIKIDESLQKRTKQIKEKKIKNEKNRKRNRILNFRVSQEEYDLINKQVEISGLSKQDYFIQLLGEHKINITEL